jgi:hypothetical protein
MALNSVSAKDLWPGVSKLRSYSTRGPAALRAGRPARETADMMAIDMLANERSKILPPTLTTLHNSILINAQHLLASETNNL